jgi:hypothetical protein
MARAWFELPAGSGWADIRHAAHAFHVYGYTTAEVRGTDRAWLRLSGAELDVSAEWIMPP